MSNDPRLPSKLSALAEHEGNYLEEDEVGRAFLSCLPQVMIEPTRTLPQAILDMDEIELREVGRCGITEYALRMAFWQEYERALTEGGIGGMKLARMLHQLMDNRSFKLVIKNPYRLAWILKPLRPYLKDMEFILQRGRERMWEVMNLPMVDAKGRPDAKIAAVIIAAQKQIEDRVHGSTIQRQQQVRVNLKSDSPELASQAMKEIEGVNGIDSRIRQLESQIKAAGVPGASAVYLPPEEKEVHGVEVHTVDQGGEDKAERVEKDAKDVDAGSGT